MLYANNIDNIDYLSIDITAIPLQQRVWKTRRFMILTLLNALLPDPFGAGHKGLRGKGAISGEDAIEMVNFML